MKLSDFVSTPGQKQDMSQSPLQTEMMDAVNIGIVDRADRSEESLRNDLYPIGKKTSTGGTANAALAATTNRCKGEIDTDGKVGAVASALASGATHKLLGSLELEGIDDAYHTVKRASRVAEIVGNKLSGKGSLNLKGSLKFAEKAVGYEVVNNALEGFELERADTFYDVGKATYRTVRKIKKHLSGGDALSSEKSLNKLSEKKSAKRSANTIKIKRKAQASTYFEREVYSTAEKTKTTATVVKGSVSVIRGMVQGLMAPLGAVAAPVLGIIVVFVLAIVPITTAISGGDEDSSNLGNLSGVQLEVAQALSDAGLDNLQIAAVMRDTPGESGWDPTIEYHGADDEHGFELLQFTDASAQNVYNYTVFASRCSTNNKNKNGAAVQAEYFMTRLPTLWNTALHHAGYYYSVAPQYSGMDTSYGVWLPTSDAGFATYCLMACYERPAVWVARDPFPNTWLLAAQSFYGQFTGGGGQDYNAFSVTQKAIVDAAKRIPSPDTDYYAAWVSNVYEDAGLPRPGGNACCRYLSFCTSTDCSQLKVSMVIGMQYSPTSNSNWYGGHLGYSHVRIYIGDGKVMKNVGYIATTDLNSWIVYNGQLGQPRWGFPPGIH